MCFLPLSILTVLISGVAIFNLERINSLNQSILQEDIPLKRNSDQLLDSVLSVERHGQRYTILRNRNRRPILCVESG